jgi:hypothetical protein
MPPICRQGASGLSRTSKRLYPSRWLKNPTFELYGNFHCSKCATFRLLMAFVSVRLLRPPLFALRKAFPLSSPWLPHCYDPFCPFSHSLPSLLTLVACFTCFSIFRTGRAQNKCFSLNASHADFATAHLLLEAVNRAARSRWGHKFCGPPRAQANPSPSAAPRCRRLPPCSP